MRWRAWVNLQSKWEIDNIEIAQGFDGIQAREVGSSGQWLDVSYALASGPPIPGQSGSGTNALVPYFGVPLEFRLVKGGGSSVVFSWYVPQDGNDPRPWRDDVT